MKQLIAVKLAPVCALATLALGTVPAAHATVLYSHVGSADPVSEGWSQGVATGAISVGPLADDLGLAAWKIDDNTTASAAGYFVTPTASEVADAQSFGWVMRARVRVVDAPDTFGGPGVGSAVNFLFRDGATSFDVQMGADSAGNAQVSLGADLNIHLDVGSGGYHLYEMVFDPLTQTADLLVDGVEIASDYAGFAINETVVSFGSGSSFDTGQGNWNLVEFEIGAAPAPVPGSLALLAAGVVGLALPRRRRRPSGLWHTT